MYLDIILEYEKILCGERKQFHSGYIRSNVDVGAIRNVLRYAVEELLEWAPEEMARKFTRETALSLGLGSIISKVPFPPGLDRRKDFFYFAEFVYPGTCRDEWKSAALAYYKKYLENTRNRSPLGFLREHKDVYLFNFLEYALPRYLPMHIDRSDPKALYRFFSSESVDGFLAGSKLSDACAIQYLYPADMLHAYLGTKGMSVSSDVYSYYRFRAFMSENGLFPPFAARD